MSLTDVKIRGTKATDKIQKLYDGGNLCLEIKPNDKRYWRYRYRINGKENIYTIGEYPTISLAAARTAREEARKLVKQGINPSLDRKTKITQQVLQNSDLFRGIASEWISYENSRKKWSSTYLDQINKTFDNDVFPFIGNLPIRNITPAHILSLLKRMEKRGAETLAIMTRQWCSKIFKYAVSNLRASNDPTFVLKDSILRPTVKSNSPLPIERVPDFLLALNKYSGHRATVIAVKLLMLTFVRTKELRMATWDEVDLEAKLWNISSDRMKMREAHIVPLSSQAIALLTELKEITGHQKWLFPNTRRSADCMSATTINRVIEYIGYKDVFSAHGFRVTASTALNDAGYRPDVIERQLAHKDTNRVRAIYNRAEYLPERTAMLQKWADFIDEVVTQNNLI